MTDTTQPTTDTAQPTTDAAARYEAFRRGRERFVRGATGPLALEGTYWITGPGSTIPGVPGVWSPRSDALPGLQVEFEPSDGVRVDGEAVAGTVQLFGSRAITPSRVELADGRSLTVVDGDGSSAVRVWNGHSDAVQRFGTIEAYPYNPDFVVEARVTRLVDVHLPVEHVRDDGRLVDEQLAARFEFDFDGRTNELAGLADDGVLITFADATTGRDTYGVGRFLKLQARDVSGDTITLDFNRAYLPPCAFSIGFNCPMPPPGNRLPFSVEAGERRALDATGVTFIPGGVFA